MQTLFGIPLDSLMQTLLIATIAAVIIVVLLALRRPILLKIGLRNVPRRRTRMLLIIFGLMLATTFISAALAVGDTISTAVRSVAVFNYGRVDEIVSGGQGDLGLFPQFISFRVQQHLAGDSDVAAIAPAFEEDTLLLADETSRQVRSQVTALAIPPGAESGFDGMRNALGAPLLSADLGPTEIYLNRTLGSLLNAKPGDVIYVYSQRWSGQRFQFTVRGIIDKSGLVGDQPTFILPLATLQNIESSPLQINRIFVANRGDGLSGVTLSDAVASRLYDFLPRNLNVNEVKENGVHLSETADDIFTRIFTLFALFSLSIGILLIFLIFVLLAAERRPEMGMARAIGMQRSQLVRLFLFEGAFYDLIASLIGIGVGVGLGIAIVALVSPVLTQAGFPLSVQLQPRSLVIAYCLGALFTLGTIIIASWLISRMTIAQAMRNLPELPAQPKSLAALLLQPLIRLLDLFGLGESLAPPWQDARHLPGDLLALAWGLTTRGIAPLVIGWLILQQAIDKQGVALFSLGLSLLIVGAALVLRWFILWLPALYRATGSLSRIKQTDLLRLDLRFRALGDRAAAAIAGLGLLLYWALPYDTLVSLGFPRFTGGIEVFFFSGVMMVFGAIWALAFNADLLLRPLTWVLRGLRKVGFILHTALVYPLHYRFRTGVNLVMFTLVIFTMTVMAVISSSVASTYGSVQNYTSGFDIEAQPFFQAIPNIHTAINHAPGVDPNIFESSLGLYQQDVEALSEFVRSDEGSDWVNINIDQNLIGSDKQLNIIVLGKKHGLSLVGVGRQVEATKAFKKYAAENAVAVTDLMLAIGMKTYNQSPATFTKKFLILLSGTPSPNDLLKWYEQFSGGLKSGVGAATELSSFWSDWCKTNPGSLRDQIQAQMLASCLLNPCALSKSNGWYVLSKQVFESPSRFTAFVSALGQGKDYVDAILFDAKTGAIRNDPRTDRLRPGLLVKKKLGYVWDAAGNAYRLDNDDWTAVPVSQINIKKL